MTVLRRLDPWLPPLLLMGVVFLLSAQPNLSTGLGSWDTILRKCAHATEYAALCFLWWRALRTTMPSRRAVAAAWLVTVSYAATDEWHQTLVTGRHGSPVDVLIDAAGAAVSAVLVLRRLALVRR
jgi:VanZ family protein